ncbi:NHLP bacteriocin system secretion protein [Curvibacter delicatus]|jgi:HlyD family secretion protein|uniref:NHLP bacteriocin system secretion protein n=1 Tax=Curvibacter delicatus TaxID=80879 RepID=UPI000829BB43|nr:NHLP bacteriocin system secretion protein [Curvibacter delicatus]
MQERQGIFRKSSLDRLASPEQLDSLIRVTSPRAWLALAAIGGLLLTALLWGIFGSIPSKVRGSCILIRPGGVDEIVAPGNGWVSDISVEAGDMVRHGQMIARVERSTSMDQIKSAEAKLHELRARQEQVKLINSRSTAEQGAYLADSERGLRAKIATAEEQVRTLEGKIRNQELLLEQGLITRQTLLNSRLEWSTARQSIDAFQNEIRQIGVRRLESRKQTDTEQSTLAIQLNEAERNLASLMRSSDQSSLVFSPFSGRVLEIKLAEGSPVNAGTSILTLEQTGASVSDLEAVVYIAPLDGKKVKTNMDVQIAPSTVRQEEFGLMVGKVKSVADFPSSTEGMQRVLRNPQLVQQLAAGAAPIAVQADLTPSATTVSGYKWTSPKGPDTRIESGTLCSATITVSNRRPISLVIPILRDNLGI